VAPELAAIVKKALAREPRNRYQSAREFSEAIEVYAEKNRLVLDHGELSLWIARLGILASRSGTHAVQSKSEPAAEEADQETTRGAAPRREIRRPTPPALSLDDGRAAGRTDLLELVATGRVRRRTKLVGRDGIGRPAVEVPGTAELLRRAAFQFGEPESRDAEWAIPIQARTLPARLFQLAATEATGLVVARSGAHEKRLFFMQGALRFVSSTLRDELIGYRLLRRGLVDEATLRPALETRARCSLHLGEILVGLGAIGPTVLLRELIDQLEDRFVDLLSWREGMLSFFPEISSGEEEVRAQNPAPALVSRGIREHYSGEEIANLLGPTARALLRRGEVQGLDPIRLGVNDAERRALERAVPAGTLERLVSSAGKEDLISLEDVLRAAFIGLSSGLLAAPSAGWTGQ
jgi:hypothetical protein